MPSPYSPRRSAGAPAAAWLDPPSAIRDQRHRIDLEIHALPEVPLEAPQFGAIRSIVFDDEGNPLVTAMLAPGGRDDKSFRPIIVGVANADPYVEHADAIRALGQLYGLSLERSRCYPYRRD